MTNPVARQWYLVKASRDGWSTTTLDRNINTQYFERRLAEHKNTPDTKLAEAVAPYNEKDPLEYIKNPMIAEFMGFRQNTQILSAQRQQQSLCRQIHGLYAYGGRAASGNRTTEAFLP